MPYNVVADRILLSTAVYVERPFFYFSGMSALLLLHLARCRKICLHVSRATKVSDNYLLTTLEPP